VGGDAYCIGLDGLQREWLLRRPRRHQPQDITPRPQWTAHAPYNTVENHNLDQLLELLLPAEPHRLQPGGAAGRQVFRDYFYRAGARLLDVHKWIHKRGAHADFTYSPLEVYPGTNGDLHRPFGGSPTGWLWSFPGG